MTSKEALMTIEKRFVFEGFDYSLEFETIYKDLDKLDKLKFWLDTADKFRVRYDYYIISKDFMDLARVVLESE